MAVLSSSLNTRSEAFQRNQNDMLDKLEYLDTLYVEAAEGGGPEAMSRLKSRGKMAIRDRIAWVLDRDAPFLEVSPLAAWRSHYAIGSGFVVGIGVIEGVECVILGHDPSVRAGAFNPFNSKKLMRGLEIARENRMPYVQFVESAGADLRGGGGGSSRGSGEPVDPKQALINSMLGEQGHFAESGRLF
ncbi:MAG: acyl-CoA carboxylase subunit beta, partial [Gammaproteobacteria bacterium]|nr:acyl-CoA carboxylase subunit beta [Gammaproteobacteria bacterium]